MIQNRINPLEYLRAECRLSRFVPYPPQAKIHMSNHVVPCECGQGIPVRISQGGQTTSCPKCHSQVAIPALGVLKTFPVAEVAESIDESNKSGNTCSSCGQRATRSCTRCGKFCCENHTKKIYFEGRTYHFSGKQICEECANSDAGCLTIIVVFSMIVVITFLIFLATR